MKFVDYHSHDLTDIPESFTFSGSLCDGTEGGLKPAASSSLPHIHNKIMLEAGFARVKS
jgi:hypothetical protein